MLVGRCGEHLHISHTGEQDIITVNGVADLLDQKPDLTSGSVTGYILFLVGKSETDLVLTYISPSDATPTFFALPQAQS